MKIIQTIENATVQYRRNVRSSPDQGQLKMHLRTVLVPDTKLQLTHDRMHQPQPMVDGKSVEKKYAHVCRTIKNRYMFDDAGQVVLARDTADVATGISDAAPVAAPIREIHAPVAEYLAATGAA